MSRAGPTKAPSRSGARRRRLRAPDVGGQVLDAGLADGLVIDVAPVVLGSGRPFFDGVGRGAPVRLSEPRVVQGTGAVHLVYEVQERSKGQTPSSEGCAGRATARRATPATRPRRSGAWSPAPAPAACRATGSGSRMVSMPRRSTCSRISRMHVSGPPTTKRPPAASSSQAWSKRVALGQHVALAPPHVGLVLPLQVRPRRAHRGRVVGADQQLLDDRRLRRRGQAGGGALRAEQRRLALQLVQAGVRVQQPGVAQAGGAAHHAVGVRRQPDRQRLLHAAAARGGRPRGGSRGPRRRPPRRPAAGARRRAWPRTPGCAARAARRPRSPPCGSRTPRRARSARR